MRPLRTFVSRTPIRRCNLLADPSTPPALHRVARLFTSTPSAFRAEKPPKDRINYNPEVFFDEAPDPEHMGYARVTSNDLERHTKSPTRVKMLVRDFIEDSLYNPHYGYFPQQATIFTSAGNPINFRAMRDSVEFQNEVAQRYSTYGTDEEGPGRQIWHTPTELFKVRFASKVHGSGSDLDAQPYYGQAIARCLVSEYLLKYFPYEDLVIYEIGAGNGTLAMDILDYVQSEYPEVYERTHYNIVEISGRLAKLQHELLVPRHSCVSITHKSIFHWDQREPAPCFFLAMEVIVGRLFPSRSLDPFILRRTTLLTT
jgi:Putative S-adenosyl-L-methionine-dependent methyltransferase